MTRQGKYYQREPYRINNRIRASKVRLVDEKKKQIGILSIEEAQKKAEEKGVDLVEIAPKAKPPVVRLINYSKFKYQQQKKKKKEKKKNKSGDLKEIQLTPFIGEADLKTRLRRLKKFHKYNDKVRFVVKFKGRQITQKDFGYNLLDKIKEQVKEIYEPDRKPKMSGRRLIMYMKPINND